MPLLPMRSSWRSGEAGELVGEFSGSLVEVEGGVLGVFVGIEVSGELDGEFVGLKVTGDILGSLVGA